MAEDQIMIFRHSMAVMFMNSLQLCFPVQGGLVFILSLMYEGFMRPRPSPPGATVIW